jgi:hypothetical protein
MKKRVNGFASLEEFGLASIYENEASSTMRSTRAVPLRDAVAPKLYMLFLQFEV